jgi:hypothetical protein
MGKFMLDKNKGTIVEAFYKSKLDAIESVCLDNLDSESKLLKAVIEILSIIGRDNESFEEEVPAKSGTYSFNDLDDISKLIVSIYKEVWKEPYRAITRIDYDWRVLELIDEDDLRDILFEHIGELFSIGYSFVDSSKYKNKCTLEYIESIQDRWK